MINEIDLQQLWKDLDIFERELDKEEKTLQDIWLKITDLKLSNEIEADKLVY